MDRKFPNASLAAMPLLTIKGNNSTTTPGAPRDLTVAEVLAMGIGGGGGTLPDGDYGDITVSGTGTVMTIDNNVVSDAKLRDSAALSVIGRTANSSGDPGDIAAGSDGQVLRRSGTSLGFGTVATAGIGDDQVTDAKLRNSVALSVIGRSANSTGDPADIAAGSDGDVLRRSGTTLGFGTIPEASVAGLVADLAAKAALASPAFTGNPTVPTAAPGDNDTTAASTAFVTAAVAAGSGGVSSDSVFAWFMGSR